MDATSSTPRRSKSMRVATIFTGVAACTVGATQAAHAQDIRPAVTARPASAIYGSIKSDLNCGLGHRESHWLHLSFYYSYYMPHMSDCFGYKGYFASPYGTGLYDECGGNNHGFLLGANGGRSQSTTFGPGNGYRAIDWSHLYGIDINSWAGTDKCGVVPGD
jgi:hypothetical protein